MPTSQLETHPFSFRSPPHLRCIARPLPPPPQPPSPYIPFPYCLQHGHSCHCIEKYHAPINHLQHRTLYQRTIRERWEGGRGGCTVLGYWLPVPVSRGGRGCPVSADGQSPVARFGCCTRSKTDVRLFYLRHEESYAVARIVSRSIFCWKKSSR